VSKAKAEPIADALLSLLLERKEDVRAARDDLASLREFQKTETGASLFGLLSSYALPKERRERLFEETVIKDEKGGLSAFYRYLFEHRLFSSLAEIERAFRLRANAHLGIEEGVAESAKPLTAGELSSLEAVLSKKRGTEVKLLNRIDPSLIGGVRCRLGDTLYDASLLGKLEGLRLTLLKGERQ